ncbi:MAG: IS30 family transposase [Steroidobacter sp.]
MGSKYSHLSYFERQLVYNWYHYQKLSIRECARRIRRSHSTLSREIRRNKSINYVPTWYPGPAQIDYECRIRDRGERLRLKTAAVRNYVCDKMQLGWSPQIIAGRLRHEHALPTVCHESIYQFIYHEAKELIQYLPRKHRKRRCKYPRRKYSPKVIKTSILERPAIINERVVAGHWESDSVESNKTLPGCNVLVERYSRLVQLTRLDSKDAQATHRAIVDRLSVHPQSLVCSITYDNGSENAAHATTNQRLHCQSYFCQPYHSWEKGTVEQSIGLIRRYMPKGTDFTQAPVKQLRQIEHLLNTRPRKVLNYQTPLEVYNKLVGALTR